MTPDDPHYNGTDSDHETFTGPLDESTWHGGERDDFEDYQTTEGSEQDG